MKKSRILIAVLYLFLIAGCMGILHILKIQEVPQVPSMTETWQETKDISKPVEPASEDREDDIQPSGQETDSRKDITENQSEEETTSEGRKESVYRSIVNETKSAESQETEAAEEEAPKGPLSIILATDTHFYSSKMTDYGDAFNRMVAGDDGKIVPYSTEILEAFLDMVLEERPTALILSGDLTLNGEKVNHQELSERLRRVKEEGISVLVIPGNHDINNTNAATYYGDERKAADPIMPSDFYNIYHEYGYDQALSRDESSLSYIYELDDKNWLMMLDSCQYVPRNLVDGKMRPETLIWMEERFEEAKELGIAVLPIAHHNLLDESLLYPTECTILNHESLLEMFERERVPLFLSGHLHLQRLQQYQPEEKRKGGGQHIYEAVTASLMIPPCQYSRLDWMEDGGFQYQTKKLDVASWAEKKGLEDENLLGFDDYSALFLEKLIADKIYKRLEYLPESHMESMSLLYSELNSAYCAGKPIDFSKIKKTAAYEQWERNRPESKLFDDIMAIIRDSERDNNFLVIPPYGE